MNRMIYHIPYYVDKSRFRGSHIRPMQMLQAFINIGYTVDVVMGYGNDRKKSIKKIKHNIQNGIIYDFCYSESSTMPTLLTEKNHIPKYPFLDFSFFKFLKNNNIKIGLFYRDCHWLFNQYKYDLKQYKKYIDIIYMPDSTMDKYLPISLGDNIQNLPPALDQEVKYKYFKKDTTVLKVFYVGGLGELYDLELFFKVIYDLNFINLTLCTRENEWNNLKDKYSKYLTNRINIIHKGPGEYDEYIENADLALLYVKPKEYWKFAIPVKLFEYMKFKKPILAVKDTAVGRFIEKYHIGYTIEYNEENLKKILVDIFNNRNYLDNIILNLNTAIEENTWESRAKKVANDLI